MSDAYINNLKEKFTSCQRVIVPDEPDEYTVWLTIDNQLFCLANNCDTKDEADWLRTQLAKALSKVVEHGQDYWDPQP